jgi:hypothetical protein
MSKAIVGRHEHVAHRRAQTPTRGLQGSVGSRKPSPARRSRGHSAMRKLAGGRRYPEAPRRPNPQRDGPLGRSHVPRGLCSATTGNPMSRAQDTLVPSR